MELDFVRWLSAKLASSEAVALGVGDDAALVEVPVGKQLVVTTDTITDGVHFEFAKHSAESIGRKALAVNLSDLAAMAASPIGAVVSLNLPRGVDIPELACRLTEGLIPLAELHNCPIIGGDTNVISGPLSLSITVLGSVDPNCVWLRSGAQVGDRLLVTGNLGGSLAGHHLDFDPRVAEALKIASGYEIHAAMDLSDGLALDLTRMTEASGVGVIIEIENLPISNAAKELSAKSGRSAIDHALGDGEDFELLLAVAPDVAERLIVEQPVACGLTDIGEATNTRELAQREADGKLELMTTAGFEHR